MLVQKLNTEDLQFEKMSPFDGTMAYAQVGKDVTIMVYVSPLSALRSSNH